LSSVIARDVRTPSGSLAERGRRVASAWLLWIGAAALIIPTIMQLAQQYWSAEEGGHGPIVLATGVWLLVRSRHAVRAVAQPGNPFLSFLALGASLLGYVFAHMTGMLGPQSLCVYVALLAIFYYHAGWRAVRLLWFPLVYFLFMLPQPETLILPLTHALKLGLSTAAVSVLGAFGYAVGHGGVVLYVDQYELLVASACSGMNSLIGLGSIGVFYAYLRYDGDWRAAAPLLLAIVPIALIANFVRVLLLLLVTHYFGIRIAYTYVHDMAGIIMFTIAVTLLLCTDRLISWRRERRT
jgi:exosortase